MDYIMGIDVGTSNVKAVLFDEKGTEIQVASRVSETINDGGNNEEQDMTIVWEKVKACITELMDSKVVAAEDIKGIGVTGQGEGCWLIDKEGKPLQKYIRSRKNILRSVNFITGQPEPRRFLAIR